MALDLDGIKTFLTGAAPPSAGPEPPLRLDRLADSERLVGVRALLDEIVALADGAFVRALEVEPLDLEGSGAEQRERAWHRFADALRRLSAPFAVQIVVTTQVQDIGVYLRRLEAQARRWRDLAEAAAEPAIAARRRRLGQAALEALAFQAAAQEQLGPLQQRYLLVLRHAPFPGRPLNLNEARVGEARAALEAQATRLRVGLEGLGLTLCDLDAAALCQALWAHYHRAPGAFDFESLDGARAPHRPPSLADLRAAARDPARLADLLAPELVEEQAGRVRVGEALARGYVIHDFDPRATVVAASVLAFPADMTHVFYLSAADPAEMRRKLRERETELKATALTGARRGAVTDWGRQAAIQELEAGRAALEIALEAPYAVHWLCLIWAGDAAALERRCRQFENSLQARGLRFYAATRRHLGLLQSARPLAALDHPVRPRYLSADALGPFFPFGRREYLDPAGWAFGRQRGTGLLICADPFRGGRDNASQLVLGSPRSGKSVYLKQLVETLVTQGERVFVLDPEREYLRLAVDLHAAYLELGKHQAPRRWRDPAAGSGADTLADLGLLFESLAARPMTADEMQALAAAAQSERAGQTLTLAALNRALRYLDHPAALEVARVLDYARGLDGGVGLNCLDLNLAGEEAWRGGAQSLAAWVEAIQARALAPGEFNALLSAYERTLHQWGFHAQDPAGWAARRAQFPVLADLAATLAAEPAPDSQALAQTLQQYATGLYADLFNTRTTLDLGREQCVVFGLRALRENAEHSLAPVFAWQALRLVWNEIVALGGAQRAHLIVDEAWYLLEQPGAARRLEHFVRSFPKYHAALHLATHEADKLLALPEAAQLAQLARVKVLFGQESDRAARALADLFGLSQAEATGLRSARQGEALLLIGHELRAPLKVTVPPARLARWATNPAQQLAVARASGRAARPVV
jgi:hypothetical protein